MQLMDVVHQVQVMLDEMLMDTEAIRAEQAGLDARCGTLTMGNDFIAVQVYDDRLLQYYGGFEYVNKTCRTEIANWVFYSLEDARVAEAYDTFYNLTLEEV
jgi:hypothetical protein